MKKTSLRLAASTFIAAAIFSFSLKPSGSVRGTIVPAEATGQVWATSGTDTSKAEFSNGTFNMSNLKAGTYKVVIDAADPYKDAVKEGVSVQDGQTTDLGETRLEK